MSDDDTEPESFSVQAFLDKLPSSLRDGLFVTGVAAIIQWAFQQFFGSIPLQPWYAIWGVIPLGLGLFLLYRLHRRGQLATARLTPGMRGFLIGYLLFFTFAAASDLLVLKRDSLLVANENHPRNWLVPAWLGDWHYWFARRPEIPVDLLIVTITGPKSTAPVDAGADRAIRRRNFARLLNIVAPAGVQGVAFDYHFEERMDEPAGTAFDRTFGEAVKQAKAQGVPVYTGVSFSRFGNFGMTSNPYPKTLDDYLLPGDRVQLQSYLEGDQCARFVAGKLKAGNYEALSLKTAAQLALKNKQELKVPDSVLWQFVFPPVDSAVPVITFDELVNKPGAQLREALRGKFILVGEESAAETFATPFGDKLGVELHAAAVYSILNGCLIQRTPWWAGMLILILTCYTLTALAGAGASRLLLIGVTAGSSFFLVVAAALAMRLWQTWLDVIYVQMATWILLGLLMAWRFPKPQRKNQK